jgi:hypothetical protein
MSFSALAIPNNYIYSSDAFSSPTLKKLVQELNSSSKPISNKMYGYDESAHSVGAGSNGTYMRQSYYGPDNIIGRSVG